MSLDITKLLNVKPCADGWTAGCPECGRNGRDSQRMHLKVWRTGAYSCAVCPSDPVHNKAIYAIAGAGDAGTAEVEPPPPRQMELPQTWPVDVLDRLIQDHSYWVGRGVSEATVAPFRGGLAADGQMKGRYVFPMFDQLNDDKLVGFSGRRVDNGDEMRWKHIGAKSLFVWGGVDEIESTHRVILVESIGDALALMEQGVKDVLCLFGVSMSQVLLAKVIALNPSSIIVSTNRDTKHSVGQNAAVKIEQTLTRFFGDGVVSIVFPPQREGVKDWGGCLPEEIKAAFPDKA